MELHMAAIVEPSVSLGSRGSIIAQPMMAKMTPPGPFHIILGPLRPLRGPAGPSQWSRAHLPMKVHVRFSPGVLMGVQYALSK